MTKSETIRELAGQGLPVAEIARRIGVRYQHAYNVLRAAGMLAQPASNIATRVGTAKGRETILRPALTRDRLTSCGFDYSGEWVVVDGTLKPSEKLPASRGVYAFVKDDAAVYVGLATMGLAKRLYFYGKPGATQRTSIRIGAALTAEIQGGGRVGIYTTTPPDLEWRGLPVAGDAGLELGLIQNFSLPWNKRGT